MVIRLCSKYRQETCERTCTLNKDYVQVYIFDDASTKHPPICIHIRAYMFMLSMSISTASHTGLRNGDSIDRLLTVEEGVQAHGRKAAGRHAHTAPVEVEGVYMCGGLCVCAYVRINVKTNLAGYRLGIHIETCPSGRVNC